MQHISKETKRYELTAEPLSLNWIVSTANRVCNWAVTKSGVGTVHMLVHPHVLDAAISCLQSLKDGGPPSTEPTENITNAVKAWRGAVDIGPIVLVLCQPLDKRLWPVSRLTLRTQLLQVNGSQSQLHIDTAVNTQLEFWDNLSFSWQRVVLLSSTSLQLNISEEGWRLSVANKQSTDVYLTPEATECLRHTVFKNDTSKVGPITCKLNPSHSTAYIFVLNNSGLEIYAHLKIGESKSRKTKVNNKSSKYLSLDFLAANHSEEWLLSKELLLQFDSSDHRSKMS